eukprot:m.232189 g.232189  ORF g.232189 m.232189 type:complete len:509 (+) comp12311_c0_seq1:2-1528(+)
MSEALSSKMAHFADNYELHLEDKASLIGTGAFSTVHKCVHRRENVAYAVKVINLEKLRTSEKPKIEREAQICQMLNHRNIVRLKECFFESKFYYLVFELVVGGELFEDIVNRQYYNERDASVCMHQIFCALQACHKKSIIHRDLKPENLLLSSKDRDAIVKLTDFGLAVTMDQGPVFFGFAGTPGYLAPEVCARRPYSMAVDMWAAGVIMYILLVGFPPFWHDDQQELFEQIKSGKYTFPSPEWDTVTPEAKDLIRHLMDVNPDTRYTVDKALAHPWIAAREEIPSTIHRQQTIDALRKFNVRRKLRGAVHVLAASRFLLAANPPPNSPPTPSTSTTSSVTPLPKSPLPPKKDPETVPAPAPPPASAPRRNYITTQLSQAASTDEQEVLDVNSRLLDAIASRDWQTYALLTDANLTCFEPEANGCLVVGQDFHKFYFENGSQSKYRMTIIDPRVRMLGDTAIVTYIRIVQESSATGAVSSKRFEETRVWHAHGAGWVNVHFHRSQLNG